MLYTVNFYIALFHSNKMTKHVERKELFLNEWHVNSSSANHIVLHRHSICNQFVAYISIQTDYSVNNKAFIDYAAWDVINQRYVDGKQQIRYDVKDYESLAKEQIPKADELLASLGYRSAEHLKWAK